MYWFLLVILPIITVGQEIVCPHNSLNAGWTVRRSYAFSDPNKCCSNQVSRWSIAEEATVHSQETGCLMEIRLASSRVLKQIFPVMCSSDSDCGETDSPGAQIECCPERYCLARAANGSSLCHANFDNDQVVTFERPRNDVEAMKHQCRLQGLHSCLTCQSVCPPGSEVKDDYREFRKKRQTVPGAQTNVVSISKPSSGAKDLNNLRGDSVVTSSSHRDMLSVRPFRWSRSGGNKDMMISTGTMEGNVVPPFVSSSDGAGPTGMAMGSMPGTGSMPDTGVENIGGGGQNNGGDDDNNGGGDDNDASNDNGGNSGGSNEGSSREPTGYNVGNCGSSPDQKDNN